MLSRLAELDSEEEITRLIQQVLGTFGTVESIHFFEPTAQNPQRIVLATMIATEPASLACSTLGLRAFGHKSLIIPVPKPNR
ncbi:hypothetical protein [Sideroxyarcus sp. TK5]